MIKLIENWYIDADSLSYSVRRKFTEEEIQKKIDENPNSGKTLDDYTDNCEIYGYYPTMEGAINGFIKKCMREKVVKGTISDVSSFLTELKDIKKQISDIISPLNEDLTKPIPRSSKEIRKPKK